MDTLVDNPISRVITRTLDWLSLPSRIISDLYNYFFERASTRKLQKILFLIGGTYMLYKVCHSIYRAYKLLGWAPEHLRLKKQFSKDWLKQRYGENSWVLITGFTHGLGLSYAKLFAQYGFNLVLVGRNKEKIKYALKWISQHNDQIMTKVIDLDFTDTDQYIYETIKKQTDGIDVGIVVNNAAFSFYGQFMDIPLAATINTYKVNVHTAVEVCRVFVPRMKEREKRSAVINVGSGVSVLPSPVIGIYTFTKVYLDFWTKAMQKEHNDKIDFLLFRPLGMTTDMLMIKGPGMVTPMHAAEASLMSLGKVPETFGSDKHKQIIAFAKQVPQEAMFRYWRNAFDSHAKTLRRT